MSIDSAILGYIIEELTYSKGDVIVEEGGHGNWVCIIMKGHVKVKKKTDKGIITLATLLEGDIIGEMAFLLAAGPIGVPPLSRHLIPWKSVFLTMNVWQGTMKTSLPGSKHCSKSS